MFLSYSSNGLKFKLRLTFIIVIRYWRTTPLRFVGIGKNCHVALRFAQFKCLEVSSRPIVTGGSGGGRVVQCFLQYPFIYRTHSAVRCGGNGKK